jgi:parallel beta-helix repeat protein
MNAKCSYGTKRIVIALLVLFGSFLISVDGQMGNLVPFGGIAYCADIIYVTTTSDVADFEQPQMIENLPGTDGVVSLREALIAANNEGGNKTIAFSIPIADVGSNGVFIIMPLEQLPPLRTDKITIDGTTQTDFTGDTNPDGPEIVLDGTYAGESTGILIGASNGHNIRGLIINSFGHEGIGFYGDQQAQVWPNDVKITKCYIGTDETGTQVKGNTWEGITITGNRHVIGGPAPENANLISGNGHDTLPQIGASAGEHTIIQGNLIGTDRTGQKALYHTTNGISLSDFRNGVVKGNLISGCSQFGIILGDFSENNLIENNMIGTDISGQNELPNVTGIQIVNAVKNTIAGNIIAFNKEKGIEVIEDAYGNRITRNSIFSNVALGIALGFFGVTPNDPGDKDIGPNDLMNFPEIKSAIATSNGLIVKGTIDTKKAKDVTIEIFANAVPHQTGFGEGATYLGSIKPTSDGKFKAALPHVSLGKWITATATDANGSTSEFSRAVEAQ